MISYQNPILALAITFSLKISQSIITQYSGSDCSSQDNQPVGDDRKKLSANDEARNLRRVSFYNQGDKRIAVVDDPNHAESLGDSVKSFLYGDSEDKK